MNAIFICSVCLVRNDLTKYYYIACSLSLSLSLSLCVVVNVATKHSSALLLQLKTFGRWGIFCRNQVALNVNPLHIFFLELIQKRVVAGVETKEWEVWGWCYLQRRRRSICFGSWENVRNFYIVFPFTFGTADAQLITFRISSPLN